MRCEAKNNLLICTTFIILFFMLGAKTIWTGEIRWANICHEMLIRHNYLQPFLFSQDYYDKPLLSYWLMIGFSYLTGGLNTWALRLPSAIAGLATVWGTYQLGAKLFSREAGRIAAWLLITTFFFIFWARIASADLLNLAGIVLAVLWYVRYRIAPGFFSYSIFFLILSITSLCKGPVAVAITILVILPDLVVQKNWRKHLRFSLLLSIIPALIIYFLPFWLSAHFNSTNYTESGLWEVFHENFVRFFKPFDQKGPIYTYFIFLPVYILPWIFFFIPALFSLPNRWKSMSWNSRWLVWALLLCFIFLTVSGSRRSYYVLPLVPFAILITTDWIRQAKYRSHLAMRVAIIFYILNLIIFGAVYPISSLGGGPEQFAHNIKQQAEQIHPWQDWHVTVLGEKIDLQVLFYLNSPHLIKFDDDIKLPKPNKTIIIMRASYVPQLKPFATQYKIIYLTKSFGARLSHKEDERIPVALVPLQRLE